MTREMPALFARDLSEPEACPTARTTSRAQPSEAMAAARFTGSGPWAPSPTTTPAPANRPASDFLASMGSSTTSTLAPRSQPTR